MRLKLFLLVVAAALMWGGGQKMYVAATNRAPTRVSVADFAAGKTNAVWVELTDGWIDYEHAISLESKVLKVDKGTFVPVLAKGTQGGPSMLLLEMRTTDVEARLDKTLETLKARAAGALEGDRSEPISGMLEWGITGLNSKVKRALDKAASDGQIARGYKVLKEGEAPSGTDLPLGAGMMLAPPVVVGGVLWFTRRGKKAAGTGAPPPLPPQP